MNYSGIKYADMINGRGIRVSLFVSGCTHCCKNCFNEETWDENYGKKFTEKEENEIIEIRGLRIDTTARRVFVDGKEVIFTSREFDLLAFLAAHPNRVFTKEELFQEIWKMESIGDIATVTVHIKKIREKIELSNAVKPQYIETIWGVGYRFKA